MYEGGLKVWEASLDLVEHLVNLLAVGTAVEERGYGNGGGDAMRDGGMAVEGRGYGNGGGDAMHDGREDGEGGWSSFERPAREGHGLRGREKRGDCVSSTARRKRVLEVCVCIWAVRPCQLLTLRRVKVMDLT